MKDLVNEMKTRSSMKRFFLNSDVFLFLAMP